MAASSSFTVAATGPARVRAGSLSYRAGAPALSTPGFLVSTRRGVVPHVSADLVHRTSLQGFALGPELCDKPGLCGMKADAGIAPHLNLPCDALLMLTTRDAWTEPQPSKNRDQGPSVFTFSGRKQVSVPELAELAQRFAPDVWVSPADEALPSHGKTRHRRALDRTLAWLDAATEATALAAAAKAAGDPSSVPAVFASVVGGTSPLLRMYAAQEASKRPHIRGFVIAGLGMGESASDRAAALDSAVEHLAAAHNTLPRVLAGVGAPSDVLAAVRSGIDIVTTIWPIQMAMDGRACCIVGSHAPGSDIDARAPAHRADCSPLQPGCACYTCSKPFSRSYLHHLFQTKELLGETLLALHNLHQYNQWFQELRHAIAEGEFDAFAARFPSSSDPVSSS